MKKTEIHISEIIKKILDDRDLKPSWLARRINCGQSCIYKILSKPNINTDTLRRISVALHYDFFVHFSKDIDNNDECLNS